MRSAPCQPKRFGNFFGDPAHPPDYSRHRSPASAVLTHQSVRAALRCKRCGHEANAITNSRRFLCFRSRCCRVIERPCSDHCISGTRPSIDRLCAKVRTFVKAALRLPLLANTHVPFASHQGCHFLPPRPSAAAQPVAKELLERYPLPVAVCSRMESQSYLGACFCRGLCLGFKFELNTLTQPARPH